jgi:hypothetical protein
MKLKQLLATIMVIGSFALIPNVTWAEGEEETPLDTTTPVPDDLKDPKDDPKYTGLPKIDYYLSSEEHLIIVVRGILHKDVEQILWKGQDITEVLEQLTTAKTVEITEQDDGFQVLVKIPMSGLPGKHEFALVFLDHNKLSATVDVDKLLAEIQDADKGFGRTEVFGKVKSRESCFWFFKCWKEAKGAKLYFYRLRSNRWIYVGGTRTNNSGNYRAVFNGRDSDRLLVVARYKNKVQRRTFRGPVSRLAPAWVGANFYLR